MKTKAILPSLLLALAVLAASGCATASRETVLKDIRENPSSGHLIGNVPFFPQSELMCGPASLASVIGYYGVKRDMKDVAREVYEEKLKGTLPIDILIYAKGKGFDAKFYRGGLEDMREKIRNKTPLILFLNLGLESYPVGHYIVAVGYNDRLRAVIAHSGVNREEVFGYDYLVTAWEKTGYSTLLITPGGGNEGRKP